MPTLGEMISFHRIEREIYGKILSLGTPAPISRDIVALWVYLQCIGIDLLAYLSDCRRDSLIQRYVVEAQSILQCVRAGTPPSHARSAIPLTASLATEQLNLRFFYFNKDAVGRGIAYVMDGSGTIIFASDFNLDLGRPYASMVAPNDMDCRTLFITCDSSRLRRASIVEFFERRWGDCVEKVVIEETPRGVVPIYGRIVLRSVYFVEVIFNNEHLLTMEMDEVAVMVRKFATN